MPGPQRMPHHSGVDCEPTRPGDCAGGQPRAGGDTAGGSAAEWVGATDAGATAVTVRYWAAARAAAGRTHDDVPAGPLSAVLAAALAQHTEQPRFAQVLSVCSVLVGESPVGDRDRDLVDVPPGTCVELLPPFAGG